MSADDAWWIRLRSLNRDKQCVCGRAYRRKGHVMQCVEAWRHAADYCNQHGMPQQWLQAEEPSYPQALHYYRSYLYPLVQQHYHALQASNQKATQPITTDQNQGPQITIPQPSNLLNLTAHQLDVQMHNQDGLYQDPSTIGFYLQDNLPNPHAISQPVTAAQIHHYSLVPQISPSPSVVPPPLPSITHGSVDPDSMELDSLPGTCISEQSEDQCTHTTDPSQSELQSEDEGYTPASQKQGSGSFSSVNDGDAASLPTPDDIHPISTAAIKANLLALKTSHGLSKQAMEDILDLVHLILPSRSDLPRSWYALSNSMGIQQARPMEMHQCANCGHLYKYLQPKQWKVVQSSTAYTANDLSQLICPTSGCQQPRFKLQSNQKQPALAQSRYYTISIEEAIRELIEDSRLHLIMEVDKNESTFFSSPEHKRIEQYFVNTLTARQVNPWKEDQVKYVLRNLVVWVDIAHDGMQTYDSNSSKGSNVLWVRLRNVPSNIHNKLLNMRVVLVGDKSIKYDSVYEDVVRQLAQFQPGAHQLQYTSVHGERQACYVVAAAFHGDMPARHMLTKGMGPMAYLPCEFCIFNAAWLPKEHSRGKYELQYKSAVATTLQYKTVHMDGCWLSVSRNKQMMGKPLQPEQAQEQEQGFKLTIAGYFSKVAQTRHIAAGQHFNKETSLKTNEQRQQLQKAVMDPAYQNLQLPDTPEPFQCFANNPKVQLTDAGHLARQQLSTDYPGLEAALGVKAPCMVQKYLPYCSFQFSFPLPTGHMLLHGVVRDLWTAIKGNSEQFLDVTAKRMLTRRSKGIGRVKDIGRKYRDILQYIRSYTMTEILAWAECYSTALLKDIKLGSSLTCSPEQQSRFTKAVKDMHTAAAWFCRPCNLQGTEYEQTLRDMSAYLWNYAMVCEELYGYQLLKPNLHQASCHLVQFCLQRGHSGNENELFIERGVQRAKSRVRKRPSANPEYTVMTASNEAVHLARYVCAMSTAEQQELLPQVRHLGDVSNCQVGTTQVRARQEINATQAVSHGNASEHITIRFPSQDMSQLATLHLDLCRELLQYWQDDIRQPKLLQAVLQLQQAWAIREVRRCWINNLMLASDKHNRRGAQNSWVAIQYANEPYASVAKVEGIYLVCPENFEGSGKAQPDQPVPTALATVYETTWHGTLHAPVYKANIDSPHPYFAARKRRGLYQLLGDNASQQLHRTLIPLQCITYKLLHVEQEVNFVGDRQQNSNMEHVFVPVSRATQAVW